MAEGAGGAGVVWSSHLHGRRDPPVQCVHETMKSEYESHIPRADRERGAAESNWVVFAK